MHDKGQRERERDSTVSNSFEIQKSRQQARLADACGGISGGMDALPAACAELATCFRESNASSSKPARGIFLARLLSEAAAASARFPGQEES